MNYKDVEEKLKEKCQELNDQGKNKQLLRMDLLIKMLKLEPELRPSVEKVLHHAFFWENKRCLDFIIEIRKKFDVLDPKLARKFKDGMEYQKVLKETSNMQKLKVELDIDKSVIYNDWTTKLDKTLAKEFNKGYDKESVSDLLKAMGSMVFISFYLFILCNYQFLFVF